MSKGIELIANACKWGSSEFEEPTIIDASCPSIPLALVASSRQVTTYDYMRDKFGQSYDASPDDISSASIHPSGKRVLVACHNKILLANSIYGAHFLQRYVGRQ